MTNQLKLTILPTIGAFRFDYKYKGCQIVPRIFEVHAYIGSYLLECSRTNLAVLAVFGSNAQSWILSKRKSALSCQNDGRVRMLASACIYHLLPQLWQRIKPHFELKLRLRIWQRLQLQLQVWLRLRQRIWARLWTTTTIKIMTTIMTTTMTTTTNIPMTTTMITNLWWK